MARARACVGGYPIMRTYTLPADTYRVRFVAFCGLAYDLDTDLTLPEARQTLARLIRRRRRSGHVISTDIRDGLTSAEFGEPENAVLIPDTAGTAWIVRETVPAWSCWACGEILPQGTACTCDDPIEEADLTEDSGRISLGLLITVAAWLGIVLSIALVATT